MTTEVRDSVSLAGNVPAMSPDTIRQVPDGVPARLLSYQEAIREALREEMHRDPAVFLMGEDIAKHGGAFGVTRTLFDEFGAERVRNTPISENTIVGAATGAALVGMRPVAEIMFVDFSGLAMDQIATQAAKIRFMTGGQCSGALGPAHAAGRRRRQVHGGPAQPEPGGLVRPHPRPQGRAALHALRRQGPHEGRHPRRQPGHLPGAQAALRLQGPGAGGGLRACRSASAT